MQTVAGLFERYEDAEQAVQELNRRGYLGKDISLIARHAVVEERLSAATGVVSGAAVGGLLGLLIGIGAIAIPGIGPVLAAGTLGTAIGSTAAGAGIGGAAGGILTALIGMGVPEPAARFYAEGIRRGGILVVVQMPDTHRAEVEQVMRVSSALDVERTRAEWQTTGWNDLAETTMPNSNDPTLLGS